jgi:8-oxo-dGTP pyrophosphatase MutT (NUDIX family)
VTQARRFRQTVPRPPWARPGSPAPWSAAGAQSAPATLDDVRRRLAGRLTPQPSAGAEPAAAAAVLVALYDAIAGPSVLLIRRGMSLAANPGEIAYPGGRLEPGETPEAAALREAEEEVGLPESAVELAGRLPVRTRSRSPGSIVPVVGYLDALPALMPSPDEVDEILPVALRDLLADGVYWEEIWSPESATPLVLPFFAGAEGLGDDLVWGATARILTDLLVLLAGG